MFKSILGFENWTKKMSKTQKRKHFPAFFIDVTGKSKNRGFIFIFQMRINNKKMIDHLVPYHKVEMDPLRKPSALVDYNAIRYIADNFTNAYIVIGCNGSSYLIGYLQK